MRGRGREIIKIIKRRKKIPPHAKCGGGGGGGDTALPSLVVRNPHNPPHEQLLVRLGRVVYRRSSSSSLLAAHRCRCRYTNDPPHEQLLVRLGVGGVSFLRRRRRSLSFRFPPRRFGCPVVLFPFSPRRVVILLVSPFFSSPSFRRPRNPPCEQVARRRGAGAIPSSSFSSVA
jgi:hypothetical protein